MKFISKIALATALASTMIGSAFAAGSTVTQGLPKASAAQTGSFDVTVINRTNDYWTEYADTASGEHYVIAVSPAGYPGDSHYITLFGRGNSVHITEVRKFDKFVLDMGTWNAPVYLYIRDDLNKKAMFTSEKK